jgi:hypothetical protein
MHAKGVHHGRRGRRLYNVPKQPRPSSEFKARIDELTSEFDAIIALKEDDSSFSLEQIQAQNRRLTELTGLMHRYNRTMQQTIYELEAGRPRERCDALMMMTDADQKLKKSLLWNWKKE